MSALAGLVGGWLLSLLLDGTAYLVALGLLALVLTALVGSRAPRTR
jgi:hypothetical protein